MPSNQQSTVWNGYYLGIDGIRAICFLVVFFFHCGVAGFQLGWCGVTLFFVISGFLITEILISSKECEHYFSRFYLRRTFRIVPIYILLICFSVIVNHYFGRTPSHDLYYLLSYTQNIYWAIVNGSSDLHTLTTHTWSLAIEEQFYLIWPLLIWLTPKKHLLFLCAFLIGFGMLFRIAAIPLNKEGRATWILLFAQLDSLGLGALLACHKAARNTNNLMNQVVKYSFKLGLFGMVVTGVAMAFLKHINIYQAYELFETAPGYVNNPFTAQIYFFISLCAVGLIHSCYASQGTLLVAILSNKLLAHLGKLSYGLYLYHWPIVFSLHRFIHSRILLCCTALPLTYVIALASFYSVEHFFNTKKDLFFFPKQPKG